jgi:hypothetical protein
MWLIKSQLLYGIIYKRCLGGMAIIFTEDVEGKYGAPGTTVSVFGMLVGNINADGVYWVSIHFTYTEFSSLSLFSFSTRTKITPPQHTFDVIPGAGPMTNNYANPVHRDIVSTGSISDNVTMRLVTDNPGPWFLQHTVNSELEACKK